MNEYRLFNPIKLKFFMRQTRFILEIELFIPFNTFTLPHQLENTFDR